MEACMRKPEAKKRQKPTKPPPKPPELRGTEPERVEKATPFIPPRPTDAEMTQTQYKISRTTVFNNEFLVNDRKRAVKPTPLVPSRPKDAELSHTQYRVLRAAAENPEMKKNDLEKKEKPTPLVPPRPADAELTQTQYRITRAAATNTEANGNQRPKDRTGKSSEPPVAPSRPKEKELSETSRHSQRRSRESPYTTAEHSAENHKPEAAPAEDQADLKQGNNSALTGIFRRSQKEKTSTFTSYVNEDEQQEEKTEDVVAKKAPGNKTGGLKGVMKGLQFKSSPKARDPSPGAEDEASEKEQEAEKNKEEKITEPKQDKGLFTGMFRKTPKEKPYPSVTFKQEDSDSEVTDREDKSQQPQESLSANRELSLSSDSLSENNKEKGGIFSGMFKKSPKPADDAQPEEDQQSQSDHVSGSNDNLSENSKDKGGFFSGILRKTPKASAEGASGQLLEPLHSELSTSTDSLSDNKDKGGLFSGLLRKTPKAPAEENLSASSDSLSEAGNASEKGGAFSGMFKKLPRLADVPSTEKEKLMADSELSGSTEGLSENTTKEKGGIFSGIFKKTPKLSEAAQSEEDDDPDKELVASSENVSENKQEKSSGLFSGLLKKTPKTTGEKTESADELSESSEDLSENTTTKEKNIFSNMFKKQQKPAEGVTEKEQDRKSGDELSVSCENLTEASVHKEKKGGFAGLFKRSASIDNLFDEEKGGLFSGLKKKPPKTSGDDSEDKEEQKELSASNDSLSENTKEKSIFSGMFKKTSKTAEGATDEDKKLSASCENLLESKEKSGGISGIFKKSPKPSPRSLVSKDPLNELKNSQDSDDLSDTESTQAELSASKENLSEVTNKKESKGGFAGMFRRTPKIVEPQESVDLETPEGGGLRRRRTIKKKRRVVSFRIKKTLPKLPKSSQASEKMPVIGETVEMQEMSTNQDNTFETQPVEMAAYPTEGSSQANEEEDELMDWWNTVKGWKEWNESSNFQAEDEDMAMEQAADRVYMAARLFVRLFNQRGASLQHRILELLALADAADEFHKKTVKAAVGGGVASVAGSVATITGLILAPFTFGASIIVTAVGIGVATAGSITSATANITDTVHSNMDRKKVEKLIQDYQEEIKDIRECMEFVQEGMDTLDEWDFEKYTQSAAKKAMNHNIKHVVKEGGRAGKALMINTDKLISTVQILSVAGGAAKAAKAISVTTGVMSALFLALDVFFLARDSHELRKGAKTKFASKIRDVCKPLQDGLLELNKVKTQLQKTMDGIEVEEYEEIEEVEVEVEDEFESDPKKLAELEQEIDLLEEKLDKKLEEEEQKKKEQEEMSIKLKRGEKEEKSMKEKENEDQKGDLEEEEEEEERDTNNDEKQEGKRESKMEKSKKENKPEPKGKEKDEETPRNTEEEQKVETENRSTAAVTEKDKNESVNERKEYRSKKGDLTPEEWRKRSLLAEGDRSQEPERTITPEWKSVTEEEDRKSMRSHGSRSDREREQKTRESHKERGGKDRTETQRRTEEEQSVKDWKAEGKNSKRERRGSREGGESRREMERKESRRSQEAEVTRRERSTESQRSHHRRELQDKPGSTVDSMRRFETAEGKEGEEEEKERRRKRREERESQRRDYEHSRRGSRSSARMTEDGLYI